MSVTCFHWPSGAWWFWGWEHEDMRRVPLVVYGEIAWPSWSHWMIPRSDFERH